MTRRRHALLVALLVTLLAALLAARSASAHEFRPALLILSERAPGVFAVEWIRDRGPGSAGLDPVMPPTCERTAPTDTRRDGPVDIDAWSIACEPPSLVGTSLGVSGLATPATAVVRVQFLDGRDDTRAVHADRPSVAIDAIRAPGEPARSAGDRGLTWAYVRLGAAHIASGVDHLAFVLALVLLVGARPRALIATITAFTVGHSATLGLAALGVVAMPVGPIEALIALSIAWVAVDVARATPGTERPDRAWRRPWLAALAFGLLHGFGFAGALTAVGLPAGDVPIALVGFNLGVELGQLAFVAILLGVRAIALRLCGQPMLARAPRVLAYAIGSVACYWALDRIAGVGDFG